MRKWLLVSYALFYAGNIYMCSYHIKPGIKFINIDIKMLVSYALYHTDNIPYQTTNKIPGDVSYLCTKSYWQQTLLN